jgi:hypothetical protein
MQCNKRPHGKDYLERATCENDCLFIAGLRHAPTADDGIATALAVRAGLAGD